MLWKVILKFISMFIQICFMSTLMWTQPYNSWYFKIMLLSLIYVITAFIPLPLHLFQALYIFSNFMVSQHKLFSFCVSVLCMVKTYFIMELNIIKYLQSLFLDFYHYLYYINRMCLWSLLYGSSHVNMWYFNGLSNHLYSTWNW